FPSSSPALSRPAPPRSSTLFPYTTLFRSCPRQSRLESFLDQRLLLLQVSRKLACRRRCGGGPADVARPQVLRADVLQDPFQVRFDEGPGPHVAGLLLAPDELRVGKTPELRHKRARREGIELLDAHQIDVVDA